MEHISENIHQLRSIIPPNVQLIAVSKTKSIEEIREAIQAGQLRFGENKVQELTEKHQHLSGVEWHFIGHLQTNKVKYIAPFIQMIQTIDSLRLLEEINKHAQKHNRVIDCLMQIHIAREEQKFGFSESEILHLLKNPKLKDLNHIRICGLMGMATYTEDQNIIRHEFRHLAQLFKRIKQDYFASEVSFCELSMGMSDDYKIAIEEGATMIRIGSTIFGKRIYTKNAADQTTTTDN
ncbi:MAG: YggS family pyridoxal phosphate-dependent enzyme [Bacteroidales bacterium]|jgi:pyridoxal phosphate enzyme (YggS family)|nr:YggS family pyridoxal phosphate-dependent enzyme [Bacteroidales bacterium]